MEAFEQFVAVALEQEGLVVSSNVKFFVRRQTNRKTYQEWQEHGYEVDLVGANAESLVLVTVKSYFGSVGVQADEVIGKRGRVGGYRLLNDSDLRSVLISLAAERYHYRPDQVSIRLYAGKFRHRRGGDDRTEIERWCKDQGVIGGDYIRVFGVEEVLQRVREAAAKKTYVDNPAIVSLKVLDAAGELASRPSLDTADA